MESLIQIGSALSTWWWLLLGLFFLLYVGLDGADLGAGIFTLFSPTEQERGAVMASMAGFWDGNETWLVVAGGVLFGAFPIVYGSAFNYLMVPLALALWSVISRAAAFEFHVYAKGSKQLWGYVFGLGSLGLPLFAGIALGATLQGFPISGSPIPHYAGNALTFISPFSLWTGVAAVIAASLAGGLYLCARFVPSDPIQARARRWTTVVSYLTLAAVLITIVWAYFIFPWAAAKWTGSHWFVWLILGMITFAFAYKAMSNHALHHDFAALLWGEGVVVVMWIGLWATLYPWIVPGTWTIKAAESPSDSLAVFTLFMTGFVPIMIMYNVYQIWVFRGRLTQTAVYGDH